MVEKSRAETIFGNAIEIGSPEEREAFLDEACHDDSELRVAVEKLVQDYFRAGSFLEHPAAQIASPTIDLPVTERPGDTIGPYKLLQQIGEGGMGVVYMAEQTQPIQRRVALKIVKPGMDTRQVITRFEAERQALAMMDHPNIAKALDAGVTDTGRPYFVMELVKGIPITEYCDEHHLTPRERLELFMPVCQAIQHAHQKGIIHRDIKPSNVLVADYDDHPVPKVIDFGVAKAIDHRLTEATMFTEFGQVLGTLEYMSPEQAKLNQWDVDTRTDIYSLGVVLYELLSGEVPFDRQRLRSAAIDELLRIIRDEEPPRPSTRLSASQSLPTIAAKRKLEPKKLSALIHGELDWIVMKALEKDRIRRYDTASKFAEDVGRYLNNEAVEACPPSTGYRLRKFARRNWPAIVAGGAIGASLLLGTGLATWQAVRATDAERLALQEADRASEEARRADTEAKKASEEAARAERELQRAEEVMVVVSEMLTNVDPREADGEDTTLLKRILDDTAQRLQKGEIKDELVAAQLHQIIGDVYRELALYPESAENFEALHRIHESHFGPDHQLTVNALGALALTCTFWGQFDRAETLHLQAIALNEQARGKLDPLTLHLKANLSHLHLLQQDYAKAEAKLLEVIESQDASGLDNTIAKATLGSVYLKWGRLHDSVRLLREVHEHKPENLAYKHNLAGALVSLAHRDYTYEFYDEAIALLDEVLSEYTQMYSFDHPLVITTSTSLARVYLVCAIDTGRTALLNKSREQCLSVINLDLHNQHDRVLEARRLLAHVCKAEGNYSEAERMLLEVADLSEHLPENFDIKTGILQDLGALYMAIEDYGKAVEYLKRSADRYREVFGDDDPHTLINERDLALGYYYLGDYENARSLLENCLPGLQAKQPGNWDTGIVQLRLIKTYLAIGEDDLAESQYRSWLQAFAKAGMESNDADYLNEVAYKVLQIEVESLRDDQQALRMASKACRLARERNDFRLWNYLDTLAAAQHATGDDQGAIATQREAMSLMPSKIAPSLRKQYQSRLDEYLASGGDSSEASDGADTGGQNTAITE